VILPPTQTLAAKIPDLKLLVVAFACRPNAGSEWHVGWTAVESLAQRHQLFVLTHVFNREHIQKVLPSQSWRSRVAFFYLGRLIPWHRNRLIARLQDWAEIRRWTKLAGNEVKTLILKEQLDAGIHITIATWRIPSPLAGLGLPWIWGPIGGGVDFPRSFLPVLSPLGRAFELMRIAANALGRRSKALQRCAQNASLVFVNTPETYKVIRELGADEARIRHLSQTFLTNERLRALQPEDKKWPAHGEKVQIVAGGTLEGLKGVSLALQALAQCKARGLKFRYRYLGRGSEMGHLCRLADRLGIGNDVQFGEWLQGEDYIHALQQAHLYLLPTLREAFPITLMEAMAAGCVPVVARRGGGVLIHENQCGIAVPVTTPNRMIEDMADAVLTLANNTKMLAGFSSVSTNFIARQFTDIHYRASIEEALSEICHGDKNNTG
jgi:glycosyltransferase involved in cell wall biosynthesis